VIEKHALLGLKPDIECKLHILECLMHAQSGDIDTDKISWYYNDLFKEYDDQSKIQNVNGKRVMFLVHDKMFIICQQTNNTKYAITLFDEMLSRKLNPKHQNRTLINNFKLCFRNENENLLKFIEGLNEEDRNAYFFSKYQKRASL
jgi:hypothetical protein